VFEPVDVLQGGIFGIVEATPRAPVADQFGVFEAVEGLRQGIVATPGRFVVPGAVEARRTTNTGSGCSRLRLSGWSELRPHVLELRFKTLPVLRAYRLHV
jgi:hypothetical protein